MTSFYEELRKTDSISDEQENAQSRKNVDKWIFRLLLFLIGFMPLIVLANVEEVISPLIANVDLLSSGAKGDLFTHYKVLILITITVITVSMLLAKVFFMGGRIHKTIMNYFLGFFVLAIVLSTIFSPNISIALNGQYNRSDGAITWLCYITLIFVAINITYPKKIVEYILITMIPFVIINLWIITSNFYGKDLLQNEFLQKVVSIALPESAQIASSSQLIGTLNQWNYMSGMFAMMTIMYLVYSLLSENNVYKVISLVISVAAMAVTLMSLSTNGFFTIVCVTPIIIFLIIKIKNFKSNIASLIIFILFTGILIHVLAQHNEKVWSESLGFFISVENPYAETITEKISEGILGEKVSAESKVFELPVLPESSWGAGTGRIYIWEETVELMEDRPLFGYGLDSLMYHFPHFQKEARGQLLVQTIVDKPHNVYVGVLFGVGVIGFLLFMSFILSTLKVIFKEIFIENSKLTALAIVWVVFLIQSLFNDTTPAIVGFVFIIIGAVHSIYLNKEQKI